MGVKFNIDCSLHKISACRIHRESHDELRLYNDGVHVGTIEFTCIPDVININGVDYHIKAS